jgi:hypothetical protein
MTPGEADAHKDTRMAAGNSVPAYTGSTEYAVTSGDTLAALASRYLGDARLWQNIAVLNGLKPPFINAQASADLTSLTDSPLPGAVGVGSKILIPNFSKDVGQLSVLPVLGVLPEATAEEHFLGTDMALKPVTADNGRTMYDIAIDTDGGSVDAKLVRGLPNLVQALKTRLATEKGTDIMYRTLGMARVVGINLTEADITLAKFRVMESLTADPRVASVRKLSYDISEASYDTLEIEADVEVRGFSQASTIKAVLTA